MTVGQLWDFLREVTRDLQPRNLAVFSTRMVDIAVGRLKVEVPMQVILGDDSGGAPITRQNCKPDIGGDAPSVTQPQMAVTSGVDRRPTSPLNTAEIVEGSFEGRVVLYKGEEMTCIKQTNDAQLRLQRADGRTTWASKKEVNLT